MVTIKRKNVEKVVKESDLSYFLDKGWEELDTPSIDREEKIDKEKELTVPELKEIAKSLQIENYSSLNKAELIKVIKDAGYEGNL